MNFHPDLRERFITAIVPQALRSTAEHSVTTLPTSVIRGAGGVAKARRGAGMTG